MSKNTKSIENLQQALSMELTAVHQYLMHAHVLDDWGLDRLAAKMREEMQEELGHAGAFIDRILFLKGEPRIEAGKTPRRAKSLEDMFKADLAEEQGAIAFYTEAAEAAAKESDIGTRTLFEHTLLDEEGHSAWLELQLDLLERMGQGAYISKHMSAPGD
ncbi:MAG: bacterioferritin [Geminicoccaceae bacterium]